MNKRFISILVLLIIFVPFGVLFTGCSDKIKEYKGTPISKIVYSSNDGWGVITTKTIDFDSNTMTNHVKVPTGMETDEETDAVLCNFSDEDGKYIVDALYTYGMFKLKESYPDKGVYHDAGSWSLKIYYEDGTDKESSGGVDGPKKVFKKSAIAIYDKTKVEFWSVPQDYKEPPAVDVQYFAYHKFDNGDTYGGMSGAGTIYKYTWNGTEVDEGSLYEFAAKTAYDNRNTKMEYPYNYLTIGTLNKRFSSTEYFRKFNHIVVKSYDYNEDLTNEKIVYEGGWIKAKNAVRVNFDYNKVYTIETSYKNGDYCVQVACLRMDYSTDV